MLDLRVTNSYSEQHGEQPSFIFSPAHLSAPCAHGVIPTRDIPAHSVPTSVPPVSAITRWDLPRRHTSARRALRPFMRDPAHLIPLAGHCALTMRHSTSPLAQRLEQTVHGAELRLGGRDGGENDGVSLEMIE